MALKQHHDIEKPIPIGHARISAGEVLPVLDHLIDYRVSEGSKGGHELDALHNVRFPNRIRSYEQGERPDVVQLEALVIAKVGETYVLNKKRHEMRTGMTRYRKFSGAWALKMPGSREVPTSRNTESPEIEERPSST